MSIELGARRSLHTRRVGAFLVASFVSAIGDGLLVTALPVGLGLERQDLRAAVMLWFIPAFAMLFATLFSSQVHERARSSRRDYASLLLVLAAVEILIAIIAVYWKMQIVALIAVFVFIYAFAKEGVPRLLYVVSVYNYFVDSKDYARIAGIHYGLTILAMVLAGILSAQLVAHSLWKWTLFIDALTFIGLSLSLVMFGRDPPQFKQEQLETGLDSSKKGALKTILWAVPTVYGVSALSVNYLPLLTENLKLAGATTSILLITFLRLPGMLSGFFFERIGKSVFSAERVVLCLPAIFVGAATAFLLLPSLITTCLLILVHGFIMGVYWPADYSIRNRLEISGQVRFNTIALRRFALFQLSGCIVALFVFSGTLPDLRVLALATFLIPVLSFLTIRRSLTIHTALLISLLSGCSAREHSPLNVKVPGISFDMKLNRDLTYAAMIFLNETSAHIARVDRDLNIQGQVLRKFERLSDGRTYRIFLQENYRSARGEAIDAQDLRATIRFYLRSLKDLRGPWMDIVGAESCTSQRCDLDGLVIKNRFEVEVTLNKPDLMFINKLASPWLVVFKEGKDAYETVGLCQIPYQTGTGLIESCLKNEIRVRVGSRVLYFYSGDTTRTDQVVLSSLNPGLPPTATLTTLAAYWNPKSSVSERSRVAIMRRWRASTVEFADRLRLLPAYLIAPRWRMPEIPKYLVVERSPVVCPKTAVKVLLDTSLPDVQTLKEILSAQGGCALQFTLTTGDRYFENFRSNDVGIAWFTPDTLDLYSSVNTFDCWFQKSCYFDWDDSVIKNSVDILRKQSERGDRRVSEIFNIEKRFLEKGYAAPLAEMNWWIVSPEGSRPIHPAGLFQVKASDFL